MTPKKQARLLVIALNFSPELTGIGKYVGEMTTWLGTAGVAVRVITAPPYYPAWCVQKPYSSHCYQRELLAGSVVYRCPLYVPRAPTGLKRLAHLASFALTSLPVMLWQGLWWRPHTVIVIEPPLACAPGALLAGALSGARTWLHVQDFEVDAAFELGLLRSGGLRRCALAIERWLLQRFDRVTSISERMVAKLRLKGVATERAGYFPNWVDTNLIRPLYAEGSMRAELGIDAQVPIVLYSGNMGDKQGLDLIVDVARRFSGRHAALFLLCGDGAARARLEAAARDLGNVRFIALQPLTRLNELLNLADVHLLPQRADAEDLVMPSKLTAIMASGRPVLATARAGSDVAQAAGVGGVVVPPGDGAAFESALHALLADPTLRSRLGSAARTYALAHWDRDVVLRRMIADLLHKSDTSPD